MSLSKKVYISGPRMGTNNFSKGIELKGIKSNGSKKRSKTSKSRGKRV